MAHKKYGEETQLISIRVPISKVDEVKRIVANYLLPINNLPKLNHSIIIDVDNLKFKEPERINLDCGCRAENNLFKRDKSCKLSKEEHNLND